MTSSHTCRYIVVAANRLSLHSDPACVSSSSPSLPSPRPHPSLFPLSRLGFSVCGVPCFPLSLFLLAPMLIQLMTVSIVQKCTRDFRSEGSSPTCNLGYLLDEFFDFYGNRLNYTTTGEGFPVLSAFFSGERARDGWKTGGVPFFCVSGRNGCFNF